MAQQSSYESVFEQLRAVLEPYAEELQVQSDAPGDYYLNAPRSPLAKQEVFGAVRMRKSYVSFHLFPVSSHPELLEDVEPGLRAYMQGKSCFNFKRLNEAQLEGIARLTRACYERFREKALA